MREHFLHAGSRRGLGDDRQADPLAQALIGNREANRLGYARMAVGQILDARRVDIVAAANDQILHAADHLQVAALVEAAEIAAHEPSVRVERRLSRALVVEIPEGEQRAAPADLPDLARSDLDIGIVLAPEPDLVTTAGAPAGRDDGPGRVA